MTAPELELARRPGVELIRTGSWSAATGRWKPTPEDITSAVEAQECPAVRRPIVKLGHTDTRFDGEPAMGWFENLRAADGGHTLVGDQVALPWLHSVQAAAYPSRSVEGLYNYACAAGHKHRFVLTAVALLGVTPPAVTTIKNLHDLPAALGVAASEMTDVPEGAERVSVTIMARRRAEDFDEGGTKRDTGGKFAKVDTNDGPGRRGPSTGSEGSAPAGGSTGGGTSSGGGASKPAAPLKDALKIGGRISLRDGETLAGGAQLDGTEGVMKVAVVDSPTGRRLHIGLNPPEVDDDGDTKSENEAEADDEDGDLDSGDAESGDDEDEAYEPWSGNQNKWTTVLDEAGTGALHAALRQMLNMGRQGAEHHKSLEKRGTYLEKRERDLVNSQYPSLTAAGKKELQKIDTRVADVTSRLDHEGDRSQRRLDELRPEDRQRIGRTDPGEARDAYREAYLAAHPGDDKAASTYAFLYAQGLEKQRALSAERQALVARRNELTGDPQPLTPEAQGELDEVRNAIRRNDGEIGDFVDDSYLTDGVVPGEWGDLVYQAVMTDTGPRYSLSLRPPGAPADWDPSDESAAVDFDDAALKKLGTLLDKVVGSSRVAASAEVHTGAMIALIPTAEDAARLAVDGGEPAEELHVTLAYLGKAADLGARGIQDVIDRVSTAANGLPRIEGDIFSVNVFNPGGGDEGRDTCLVWGVGGDILDAVHDLISEALSFVEVPLAASHRPWVPHITAAYTDDLSRISELASRVGPVKFDRLRMAFGGEWTDIPLMEWPGEDVDDEEAVAAAAGNADTLHDYWTKGKGLARWKGTPHPWTALFKQLVKHLGSDKAKRTASKWYREVMGHMPNQHGKVAAAEHPPGGQHDGPPASESHLPTPPTPGGVFHAPAAEPDPSTTEEDMVSLDPDVRQRLGLADDADKTAMLAAIDELKTKADTPPPPAEPSPEQVAASAAADEKRAELEKEVAALSSRMAEVTSELAAAKAEKVETVKASVLGAAIKDGKIKPTDKDQWSKDYDEAPGVTTRVLASIAPGTAVPVMASGHTGPAEPDALDPDAITDAELNAWASQLGVDPKELANG